MIKALIFDLDGVIVDTAKYHYLAWKELADSLGFEFTKEQNERLKGVSRMKSLDILLEIGNLSFSEEQKLKFAEEKNKKYVEFITKMKKDEILPGVVDFIESSKKAGLRTALGSASKNAMTILKQIDILKYFDAVIDGTKVSKAKPDPEVFLKGAKTLNVNPNECIVFEDAQAGIEAALNGGMYCVGIGDNNTLKKANYVMPGFVGINFQKLIDIIK